MAQRKPATNHPPPHSLAKKGASEQIDSTKEHKPKSHLTDRESILDPEDEYSENTASSLNASDIIVKPIVSESPETKKPSPTLSERSGWVSRSRSNKDKFNPPPFMVLGLPVQDNKPTLPKQGNKKRSSKTK
ncbi:hypothetical protein WN944_027292 [Citrus x changshan-huyou]|uniref:Uncharacterized protein n=1 Tax=Citrus x changshan-huyou TaxID=2935761 RepID=A0AAP0LHQ8_9ROSI